MEIFRSIDLLIYSQLILVYIIVHMYKYRPRNEWSTKLFLFIAYALSAVNILEAVTWSLDYFHPPWAFQLIFLTNTVLLALNSMPATVWVAYADFKIFDDIEGLKKRMRWYFTPFYISVVLLIINVQTGIVFTVDANNRYSRSIGLYIIAVMTYVMITILYLHTKKYKKQIDGKVMQSIFLFMLVPIVAGFIQMLVYGLLIIWPAFILATLIAFINLEKDAILKDPLTGLSTRALFEQRLQYLIKREIEFSILMIDMNHFKSINDCYGHLEGDQALITAASIIKHSVKIYDMVCRYGGDEFVVLVESDDPDASSRVKERMQQEMDAYNQKRIKPYELSMSYGLVFVNRSDGRTLEEILHEADALMYADKKKWSD